MKFQKLGLSLLLLSLWLPVQAIEPTAHPRLQKVFDELIAEQVYERQELLDLFAVAQVQQSVLDAMQSPAEYKLTWGKYRKIFMQEDRIERGVDFWLEYEDVLTRAQEQYGVPASMILAILGVESKFGRYKGKHKVLDSLVSLVVGFERRSAFFAGELKEFLVLTKRNSMDAAEILGSYAGAVGYPQFISSSYRNYAVDFNGDGKIDLIDQPEDAIGSIANYFVENGWRAGKPVVSKAHSEVPEPVKELVSRKRKVAHSAAKLRSLGAPIEEGVDAQESLGVVMLNASEIVPDEKNKTVYLVRSGDTACEIAEAHNVPCATLFKLNKLNARGDIYRGQRLKLPNSVKPNNESEAVVSNTEIPRYFFTHHNFYVITRYNQSVLYAMAVNELAQAIDAAHTSRLSQNQDLAADAEATQ